MTPEPKFRELYERKIDVPSYKDMIRDIENGKHVFIEWKIKLQFIMKNQYLESDRCDLALGKRVLGNKKFLMSQSFWN
jgi:hypothetical protein